MIAPRMGPKDPVQRSITLWTLETRFSGWKGRALSQPGQAAQRRQGRDEEKRGEVEGGFEGEGPREEWQWRGDPGQLATLAVLPLPPPGLLTSLAEERSAGNSDCGGDREPKDCTAGVWAWPGSRRGSRATSPTRRPGEWDRRWALCRAFPPSPHPSSGPRCRPAPASEALSITQSLTTGISVLAGATHAAGCTAGTPLTPARPGRQLHERPREELWADEGAALRLLEARAQAAAALAQPRPAHHHLLRQGNARI